MTLLDQATEHLLAGRIETAESLCRTVLETQPDQIGVYYLLALIANAKADYETTLFLADLAIQLGAGVAELHVEQGRALLGLGRRMEAAAALKMALKLSPEVPDGARLLSLAETPQEPDEAHP